MTRSDPVWVASLPDIAVMKAYACQNRIEECDLLYTLGKMKRAGQTPVQYGIKQREIATIQRVLAGDEEGEVRLSKMMG
jgi:hypothetical protein